MRIAEIFSRFIKFIVLSSFAILIYQAGFASVGLSQDIIVNRLNPVDTVTIYELKDIYLSKKQFWSHGVERRSIKLVVNHGDIKYSFFDMIQTHEVDFKRHWYKLIYSGIADSPKGVQNDNEVIRFVSENVGAIGFVTPGVSGEGVKKIRVIH